VNRNEAGKEIRFPVILSAAVGAVGACGLVHRSTFWVIVAGKRPLPVATFTARRPALSSLPPA
jgi:hypothetical protein